MPIFRLNHELIFPHPGQADESGLLAIGGDLSAARILLAYTVGIFPWFNSDEPILWWSPDPRFILEPENFHCSRSLRKTLRRGYYQVTLNRDFDGVLHGCASTPRQGQSGTWLGQEMREAYRELFRLGYAHSVETWHENDLVGGLYGLTLGQCFFGESMFSLQPDASKVALACLVEHLRELDFKLIDCQMPTDHLASLGAHGVSREKYLQLLREAGVVPGGISDPPSFKIDEK